MKRLALILLAAMTGAPMASVAQPPARPPQAAPAPLRDGVRVLQGALPEGGTWVAHVPPNWTGATLLVSHGYRRGPDNPAVNTLSRDPALHETLLARGYALVGGSYRTAGWAVADAPADQIAALDAFERQAGRSRRVLAVGQSMGGLVSIALVERYPQRFAGALPICASVSGALPMMNLAFDGVFAVKTLLEPRLQIVGAADWEAERALTQAALERAQTTPQGRARVALAAALAGLPTWSDPQSPRPAADDLDAQQAQMARTFMVGAVLPRDDQERRAGGSFSWNTGVDYAARLRASGRLPLVRELYRRARLDLNADLARLNAAPRVSADLGAVTYMRGAYSPSGRTTVPVLTLHEIGDGATSVVYESEFRRRVVAAGRSALLRQLFIDRPGHCATTSAETAAALEVLEARVASGRWPAITPAALNARAAATNLGGSDFIAYIPPPMGRSEDAQPRARRP